MSATFSLLKRSRVKLEFHDADTNTDVLARIVADTFDTRDFLTLFMWQAERHADILATILARMAAMSVSVSVSVSASWNTSFILISGLHISRVRSLFGRYADSFR